MRELIIAALSAVFAAAVFADTFTWTGSAGDGDFTNQENWQSGLVPTNGAATLAKFPVANGTETTVANVFGYVGQIEKTRGSSNMGTLTINAAWWKSGVLQFGEGYGDQPLGTIVVKDSWLDAVQLYMRKKMWPVARMELRDSFLDNGVWTTYQTDQGAVPTTNETWFAVDGGEYTFTSAYTALNGLYSGPDTRFTITGGSVLLAKYNGHVKNNQTLVISNGAAFSMTSAEAFSIGTGAVGTTGLVAIVDGGVLKRIGYVGNGTLLMSVNQTVSGAVQRVHIDGGSLFLGRTSGSRTGGSYDDSHDADVPKFNNPGIAESNLRTLGRNGAEIFYGTELPRHPGGVTSRLGVFWSKAPELGPDEKDGGIVYRGNQTVYLTNYWDRVYEGPTTVNGANMVLLGKYSGGSTRCNEFGAGDFTAKGGMLSLRNAGTHVFAWGDGAKTRVAGDLTLDIRGTGVGADLGAVVRDGRGVMGVQVVNEEDNEVGGAQKIYASVATDAGTGLVNVPIFGVSRYAGTGVSSLYTVAQKITLLTCADGELRVAATRDGLAPEDNAATVARLTENATIDDDKTLGALSVTPTNAPTGVTLTIADGKTLHLGNASGLAYLVLNQNNNGGISYPTMTTVTGGTIDIGTNELVVASMNRKQDNGDRQLPEIRSVISGTGGLTVYSPYVSEGGVGSGAGGVELHKANTYSGGTVVQNGIVIALDAASFGAGVVAVNGNRYNGGNVQLAAKNKTFANNFRLEGFGIVGEAGNIMDKDPYSALTISVPAVVVAGDVEIGPEGAKIDAGGGAVHREGNASVVFTGDFIGQGKVWLQTSSTGQYRGSGKEIRVEGALRNEGGVEIYEGVWGGSNHIVFAGDTLLGKVFEVNGTNSVAVFENPAEATIVGRTSGNGVIALGGNRVTFENAAFFTGTLTNAVEGVPGKARLRTARRRAPVDCDARGALDLALDPGAGDVFLVRRALDFTGTLALESGSAALDTDGMIGEKVVLKLAAGTTLDLGGKTARVHRKDGPGRVVNGTLEQTAASGTVLLYK